MYSNKAEVVELVITIMFTNETTGCTNNKSKKSHKA